MTEQRKRNLWRYRRGVTMKCEETEIGLCGKEGARRKKEVTEENTDTAQGLKIWKDE